MVENITEIVDELPEDADEESSQECHLADLRVIKSAFDHVEIDDAEYGDSVDGEVRLTDDEANQR